MTLVQNPTSPASPDPEAVRSLLMKNWMTHDAMWFANAVATLGIESANVMNRAAVHQMAGVEAKRICRLIGMAEVSSAADLRDFFEAAIALVIPDFIDFEMSWSPESDEATFVIQRCFAFEGVTALGVADRYECGIYERIYGWLRQLGVGYEVVPDVAHCTMHHEGSCHRTFRWLL